MRKEVIQVAVYVALMAGLVALMVVLP
jgi:hypothetical protein